METISSSSSADVNHNNNFNLLRLVAALFVIITHSYGLLGQKAYEPLIYWTDDRLSFAEVGLYIFFFISGLLVTQSAKHTNNWKAFIIKRALRIYPALIIVIILTVFLVGPLFTRMALSDYFQNKDTWLYLTSISGFRIQRLLPGVFELSHKSVNTSLWTLTIELKLYTLLCLFMLIRLFQYKKTYVLICFLVIGLYFFILYFLPTSTLILPEAMKLIAMFFIGSLFTTITFNKNVQIVMMLSGLTFCLLGIFYSSLGFLFNVGELLFFSAFTYYIGTISFIVNLRTDISYGLYLSGFPIQQILFDLSGYQQSVLSNILLAILFSGMFGYLSWIYIEKLCLQLKRYL